jgi:hypothetical protein
MNIGVLLDMDILLLYCSVIPSAESFNFFYCLFADTAGISAAFLKPVSFHYHYDASHD